MDGILLSYGQSAWINPKDRREDNEEEEDACSSTIGF